MTTDVLDTATIDTAESAHLRPACFHCGALCPDDSISIGTHQFCCAGCKTVYEILHQNGLERFYELEQAPGIRMTRIPRADRFAYLDEEPIRRRLLDFSDGQHARATFHIPAIHCIACVWLLENIYRLKTGIGRSEVNFPRKEVSIAFAERQVSLSALVALLASLGYEPALNLGSIESPPADPTARRLLIKIGVAGFAFGNIMLLSFPTYLGLDPSTEELMQRSFGHISLLLALPVLLFSASDYWQAAWLCFRRRMITIELPIAIGLAALFAQSAWDIFGRHGEGYLDSFSGLVFLLLCGRWFQRKTYESLSFERDYKSYFPLSVIRKSAHGEVPVPITSLAVGDRVIVRAQELIPADAVLIAGEGLVDYSFVSGEAAPVARQVGDYLYAGGRQAGGAIEIEIVKAVSQSYLTALWNSEAFQKTDKPDLLSLTNIAGRYFTYAVIGIAASVALFWSLRDPSVVARAFSAVLIVACPCALALAAPFTLGSAMRIFGRHGLYLRNTSVVERLARISAIVFDKTGTLTFAGASDFKYQGEPLSAEEQQAVGALAAHSTHPFSRGLGEMLEGYGIVEDFQEHPGCGVEGRIAGRHYRIGSKSWLHAQGDDASAVYVAVDGAVRGRYVARSAYRPALARLMERLSACAVSIISGDDERERGALREIGGERVALRFRQSPFDKLAYVRQLQANRERVLMIGDGLNDAGALRQSDVGIAVTEDIATFTPSSDAILDARHFGDLPCFLRAARSAVRVLKISFAVSLSYNAIAIGIAASGHLSPLISAILMPLSSFSVIAFSLLATNTVAGRAGLR